MDLPQKHLPWGRFTEQQSKQSRTNTNLTWYMSAIHFFHTHTHPEFSISLQNQLGILRIYVDLKNSIYFKNAGNSKIDTTHNKSWHFFCPQSFLQHEKHHLWTVRSWISNIPNDQELPWRITSWNLPKYLIFFIMCWLLLSHGFILASMGALSVPQACTGELEMINYVISSYKGRGDSQD